MLEQLVISFKNAIEEKVLIEVYDIVKQYL